MKKIVINGGKTLSGTIEVSGAKNSAVALLPASILCDEYSDIYNVPNITDKNALIDIITLLNGKVEEENGRLRIDTHDIKSVPIPNELSSKLRASYYFIGSLLGRNHHVEISFPGGCQIGERKIDYHLKGFKALGATVEEKNGMFYVHADELIGTKIYLDFASVGATINIMLAAVKAKGTTIIRNAAKEPEIVNIATYLNNMGAKISGAGTSKITIIGVEYLHKSMIEVIPDRIEAGTYLIAGALIGKNLRIKNVIREHLIALISKLTEMGYNFNMKENEITISAIDKPKNVSITTLIYPGFPTDLAQPMTTLLTKCHGTSYLEETIYSNRMGQVPSLNKMGANIKVENNRAFITGPTDLNGDVVEGTDLRCCASLVLAGLIANGETTVLNVEHLLRGYENIVEKLSAVGADIKLID